MKDCIFRKKQVYVTPVTRLVAIEPVSIVCGSGNVTPDAGGSNSSWEEGGEYEGGSVTFGEEENVAPAKWSVWEEEE